MMGRRRHFFVIVFLVTILLPTFLAAQSASILDDIGIKEVDKILPIHQQLRILGFLTLLALIPVIVVMMTSFTRISIVFTFLRQAIGMQQVPSGQIVFGLSLILTAFIMHPVIQEVQTKAITPYMNDEFQDHPDVQLGLKSEDSLLVENAWSPLRRFLLHHTREKDMILFLDIGHIELPILENTPEEGIDYSPTGPAYDLDAIPWYCLVPSFVLSELRVAFMMGFLLFVPFLVIDMIVASILMSMGMMMLPPVMISLPFKLLLFILIDGWRLVIQQMVNGFYPMG